MERFKRIKANEEKLNKKKYKINEIKKCYEYAWMDCYAYVVREKETNKFICAWRSEEEVEEKLKSLLSNH